MQRSHSGFSRPGTALAMALLTACSGGGGLDAGSGTDTTAPVAGAVADGDGADIDNQSSTTTIRANWSGFTDDSGSIASYQWAIGSSSGGTDVMSWQTVGAATSASHAGLSLTSGMTYYVSVRAYDAAGNQSPSSVSDGVTVDSGGGGGGSAGPTMASSVGQWGITWQFDQDMQVGRFCNGDWWVLGPVNVIDITPHTATVGGRVVNGSMINPVPNGEHGYDSTLYHPYESGRYKANLNVATGVSASNPLVLPPQTSLISVISQMDPAANGSFSQLQTAAVLTVLPAVPPADAFRPAYTGTDKTIRFRENDLDYGRLATIAPAGSPPDLAATADRFARVWLDHTPGWASRFLHPVQNMPDYGRDFVSLYGTGALLAQLDVPVSQKRDLVVRLVQIGIDDWGNVSNGCSWPGEGGHGSGRKFPILFAGALLGDAAMSGIGTTHPSGYYGPNHPNNSAWFGEDCQTFVVQETSPGVYNWGFGSYNATYAGLPEWGNSHSRYPSNDHSNWTQDPYRRCCTANAWVGQTLAARLMALTGAWNHPAYFDYMDRFMQTEQPGQWTRSWEPWHEQMWDAWRSQL